MPRMHIHIQDREIIEGFVEQEDWEAQFGPRTDQRQEARDGAERRSNGVRRFGGAESIDRRRADRRKHKRR